MNIEETLTDSLITFIIWNTKLTEAPVAWYSWALITWESSCLARNAFTASTENKNAVPRRLLYANPSRDSSSNFTCSDASTAWE